MATGRVLTSPEAREAVTSMQQMIGELQSQVQQLDQKGRRLSEPEVWDGPKADHFRAGQWPDAKRTLDNIVSELEQLRATVKTINENIMSAGS